MRDHWRRGKRAPPFATDINLTPAKRSIVAVRKGPTPASQPHACPPAPSCPCVPSPPCPTGGRNMPALHDSQAGGALPRSSGRYHRRGRHAKIAATVASVERRLERIPDRSSHVNGTAFDPVHPQFTKRKAGLISCANIVRRSGFCAAGAEWRRHGGRWRACRP